MQLLTLFLVVVGLIALAGSILVTQEYTRKSLLDTGTTTVDDGFCLGCHAGERNEPRVTYPEL